MSDTPDIPALRALSAERLVKDDVLWGIIHGEENRKGWATLDEGEGQRVLSVKHHDTGAVTVRVQTPQGPSNWAMGRNTQVLIEFKTVQQSPR